MLVASLAIALVVAVTGTAFSGFTSQADNSGEVVSAAPGWAGPTGSTRSITKGAGGIGNYLAQNTQF